MAMADVAAEERRLVAIVFTAMVKYTARAQQAHHGCERGDATPAPGGEGNQRSVGGREEPPGEKADTAPDESLKRPR
jgi:hypothetical protein